MTKPSEMEGAPLSPLTSRSDPVAQRPHPAVQIQQLTDDGADDHGKNSNQGVLSLQTAADSQIHDTQGHTLHDNGLEPISQLRAAGGKKSGKVLCQPGQSHTNQGAGQDCKGIYDGTC